jgi:hypothetical protein
MGFNSGFKGLKTAIWHLLMYEPLIAVHITTPSQTRDTCTKAISTSQTAARSVAGKTLKLALYITGLWEITYRKLHVLTFVVVHMRLLCVIKTSCYSMRFRRDVNKNPLRLGFTVGTNFMICSY